MGLITIPHIFKNDVQGKMTNLDSCFGSIVTLVNGNLDETNVKKSQDAVKVGGFNINANPVASSILPLSASSKYPVGLRNLSINSQTIVWNNAFGPAPYDASFWQTNPNPAAPSGASMFRLIVTCRFAVSGDDSAYGNIYFGGVLDDTRSYIPKVSLSCTPSNQKAIRWFITPWFTIGLFTPSIYWGSKLTSGTAGSVGFSLDSYLIQYR